jgi:hypothetical protein
MRLSTAFNTMLGIPGATVAAVRFEPSCVVIRLRRRGNGQSAHAVGRAEPCLTAPSDAGAIWTWVECACSWRPSPAAGVPIPPTGAHRAGALGPTWGSALP